MKKNSPQLNIEKSLCGWLVLSAVHKGQIIERKFCGYSLKDAKRKFKQELS